MASIHVAPLFGLAPNISVVLPIMDHHLPVNFVVWSLLVAILSPFTHFIFYWFVRCNFLLWQTEMGLWNKDWPIWNFVSL